MCTLVGADGGVTSLDASVVSVNVYVVAGVRCRRTTSVSPYQFRCWLTGVPFAKMRYVTNVEVSSSTRPHVSRTCEGPRTSPERVGAGGGAVSASVVTVRRLLFPEVLRLLSTAVT